MRSNKGAKRGRSDELRHVVGHVCHVRGGAKIELSVEMSEGVISLERIWGILNKRGGTRGTKGERIRKFVDRKQRDGETIMEFSDDLYRIARTITDMDSWKDLLLEVFITNVLRSHLKISCK